MSIPGAPDDPRPDGPPLDDPHAPVDPDTPVPPTEDPPD